MILLEREKSCNDISLKSVRLNMPLPLPLTKALGSELELAPPGAGLGLPTDPK